MHDNSGDEQMANTMGGGQLHTPQSIFQHMMGQQNVQQPQQPGPWLQMPQLPPLSMPWTVPGLQQPDLIRFTGERTPPNYGPLLHQKRKLEEPDLINRRGTKQFITEEKMAAHFQDMHISTNYHSQNISSTLEPQPSCSKDAAILDLDMDGSSDVEQSKSLHPRLVISEELKRIQQEPILPTSLLSKLERPSMALVLWEPPSRHLRMLPAPRDTTTRGPNVRRDENNSNNGGNNPNNNSEGGANNNNEGIPDLNQQIVDPMSLEPMDL